jgi:hypothetical protein
MLPAVITDAGTVTPPLDIDIDFPASLATNVYADDCVFIAEPVELTVIAADPL